MPMKTTTNLKTALVLMAVLAMAAFTTPLSAQTAPTEAQMQAAYAAELANLEVEASEITPEQAKTIVAALVAQFGAENVVAITKFLIQENAGTPLAAARFRTAAAAVAPVQQAAINQIPGPGQGSLPTTLGAAEQRGQDRAVVSPADADNE